MLERIASLPSPAHAKAVLPNGLIAIAFAPILIKICNAPPLILAAYRLILTILLLLGIYFSAREEKQLEKI
jgi:hypothetical protein